MDDDNIDFNFDMTKGKTLIKDLPKETTLNYINYGIGNLLGNTIYINKLFLKHKREHDIILDHEIRHFLKEPKLDLKMGFDIKLMFIILIHPSTWIQYSPLIKLGTKWTYDKTMILAWIFIIAWIVLVMNIRHLIVQSGGKLLIP